MIHIIFDNDSKLISKLLLHCYQNLISVRFILSTLMPKKQFITLFVNIRSLFRDPELC